MIHRTVVIKQHLEDFVNPFRCCRVILGIFLREVP